MPTFQDMQKGYRNLWNKAKVLPSQRSNLEKIVSRILANKARYQQIEKLTTVPWFVIAVLHYRESNLNFKTHLHCGDPLTARTVHVPAGRPKTGNPPFTFEESAVDALQLKGLHKIGLWPIERILYECERYNGWGYLNKGNSPYIWSGTDQYTGGKYVADHVYSASAVDKQMGCAALLKVLAEKDISVKSKIITPTVTDDSAVIGGVVATGGLMYFFQQHIVEIGAVAILALCAFIAYRYITKKD
jgi:lysozyme family protein